MVSGGSTLTKLETLEEHDTEIDRWQIDRLEIDSRDDLSTSVGTTTSEEIRLNGMD